MGEVSCLAVYDDRLIVGGQFTAFGDVTANSIAAWDGTSWTALGSGVDAWVDALTVYDGELIAAGWFFYAGGLYVGNIAAWNGTSWSALGTGTNTTVRALTVYDGKLIVGGEFTEAGGVSANGVAAWDGANWSELGTGMDRRVWSLTTFNDKLIAGGEFVTAGGVSARFVASWDGTNWSALDSGTNGAVIALVVYDNKLIASGNFDSAGGVYVDGPAAWNGTAWEALPGNTGYSGRLAVYDNKLIVGGGDLDGLYSWDGISWSQLGTGTDRRAQAMIAFNNELVVGGDFLKAGGKVSPHLAIWNKPSTVGFNVSPGGDTASVFALVQADIDGDNRADFVFTGNDPGDSLSIAYGRADGTLENSRGYIIFPQAAIAVGYVNTDTLLDIIARSTTQTKVLLNIGDRSFSVLTLPFAQSGLDPLGSDAATVPAISTGYFNADSKLDFIATPNLVAFGDGTGSFPSTATLPAAVTSLGTADLNGDFSDDVVAVVGDSILLYLNDGSATLTRSAAVAIGRPFDIATILSGPDLSKDGRADCVVITGRQDSLTVPSKVTVLLGNGSGGIQSKDTFSVSGLARAATLSDIDHDQNLDLSLVNSGSNRLQVFFGNGVGVFPDSISALLASGRPLDALANGDLNRDGNPDFVSGGDSTAIVTATNDLPALPVRPEEMVVTGYGGFNLSVFNPLSYVISRQLQTVAGSAWWQKDVNGDNIRDVRTFDYNLLNGEYRFVLSPTPLVPPGGNVTMDIRVDGSQSIRIFNNYSGAFGGLSSNVALAADTSQDSLVFYYTVETSSSMHPANGLKTLTTRQPLFAFGRLLDTTTATRYQIQIDRYYDLRGPIYNDTTLLKPQYVPPAPFGQDSIFYWRVRSKNGGQWSGWSRTMVANIGQGCCVGTSGNVNGIGGVDLADLSALVSFLTGGGFVFPCAPEANVNTMGGVDLADLSALVSYLTGGGYVLPSCP
ncbi:MAG: VCBS repeat-containing protein [Candidatus Zixiibacteriota bacterium]